VDTHHHLPEIVKKWVSRSPGLSLGCPGLSVSKIQNIEKRYMNSNIIRILEIWPKTPRFLFDGIETAKTDPDADTDPDPDKALN
jgi:hypothetical protein